MNGFHCKLSSSGKIGITPVFERFAAKIGAQLLEACFVIWDGAMKAYSRSKNWSLNGQRRLQIVQVSLMIL